MGFSRQEYWSVLPYPSPVDLPHPGTERTSPALAGGFFTTEPPRKPYAYIHVYILFSGHFPLYIIKYILYILNIIPCAIY